MTTKIFSNSLFIKILFRMNKHVLSSLDNGPGPEHCQTGLNSQPRRCWAAEDVSVNTLPWEISSLLFSFMTFWAGLPYQLQITGCGHTAASCGTWHWETLTLGTAGMRDSQDDGSSVTVPQDRARVSSPLSAAWKMTAPCVLLAKCPLWTAGTGLAVRRQFVLSFGRSLQHPHHFCLTSVFRAVHSHAWQVPVWGKAAVWLPLCSFICTRLDLETELYKR